MKFTVSLFLMIFSWSLTQAQIANVSDSTDDPENIVSGDIQANTAQVNGNCGTNTIIANPLRFTLFQNNTPVLNYQPTSGNTYSLPVGQGDYQVVPSVNFSDGFNVVPDQFDVSFVGNSGELFEQDLCMVPRVETVDGIEIKFYPFYDNPDPFINRFDAYIVLKNTNAISYTGQLRLNYDDNYTLLIDYDEIPNSDTNGDAIWNTINIGPNSVSSIFLRIGYNAENHPNYPLLVGDELVFDLFLTNTGNGDTESNIPSFRLTQTVDADEEVLNTEEFETISPLKIKIYPNPSNGIINIENNEHIKDISIFSMTGQLVNSIKYEQNNSKLINMDISQLDKGIYFLSIQTETSIFTKKIIKN